MNLNFAGYTYRFWLLTTYNRYEPEDFTTSQIDGGILARSEHFSYGEGSGRSPGFFEVRLDDQSGRVSWSASARHTEPIKGIKVEISPLPAGPVLVPFEEINLKAGYPGRCLIYPGGYYPIRHISSTDTLPGSGPVRDWAAAFSLFKGEHGWVGLSAREYPPRVKKIWLYRKDDQHIVHLYSEADASRRETTYRAPTWVIEPVEDWRKFVEDHSKWFGEAFGLSRFENRANVQPWLREIALVVILHGMTHDGKICHTYDQMADRLAEMAARFPPGKTLVKLAGFEGHIDRHWPDTLPAQALGGDEAFHRLMASAHRLGYHVMPHLNVWGASYENSRTSTFLPHQIFDPEGRPCTWSYDYDQDEVAEEIFAYISPDSAEWRQAVRQNITGLVSRGLDAIYLDQTGTFINDLRHDHFRGLKALYADLATAFPETQFAGEGPTHEITASLCSLVCGISTLPTPQLAELYRLLFGPYIRQYGYNLPPEPYRGVWGAPTHVTEDWSREQFLRYEERSERVHGIPTLNITDHRIDLSTELVKTVLDRASHYRMV